MEMVKVLEGFYHRTTRRITEIQAKRVADGRWEYPPLLAKLESVGLHPIQDYIWRQKATITAQVACLPIYELCTESDKRMGTNYIAERIW